MKKYRNDIEKQIENIIADRLRAKGHAVVQQMRLPSGIADIVDLTDRVVIECKARYRDIIDVQNALDQAHRYAKCLPGFYTGMGAEDDPFWTLDYWCNGNYGLYLAAEERDKTHQKWLRNRERINNEGWREDTPTYFVRLGQQ